MQICCLTYIWLCSLQHLNDLKVPFGIFTTISELYVMQQRKVFICKLIIDIIM